MIIASLPRYLAWDHQVVTELAVSLSKSSDYDSVWTPMVTLGYAYFRKPPYYMYIYIHYIYIQYIHYYIYIYIIIIVTIIIITVDWFSYIMFSQIHAFPLRRNRCEGVTAGSHQLMFSNYAFHVLKWQHRIVLQVANTVVQPRNDVTPFSSKLLALCFF